MASDKPRLLAYLALSTIAPFGCSGSIGGDGQEPPQGASSRSTPSGQERSPSGPRQPVAPGAPPAAPGVVVDGAGPLPLRRLTERQYVNTIRDLFGDAAAAGLDLPGDTEDQDTRFIGSGAISEVEVSAYRDAAVSVGQALRGEMRKLVGCTPAGNSADDCVRGFLRGTGRRVYRRPLADAEMTELAQYYEKVRAELGYGADETLRVVLQVMLQSPGFLYRWEDAGGRPSVREGGLVRLPPHQLASRLSYFLWSSMPDATLDAAADVGKLATAAEVEAQARRMVASPKFAVTAEAFHAQWLRVSDVSEVTKDPRVFPDYTAALLGDVATETGRFVRSVFLDGGDGRFDTLLTARHTYANAGVAKLYGVSGVSGTEWKRIALDPAQRAGIFTQAAFLARKALPYSGSPVKRGYALREQLLCERVPLAGDIVITPPPAQKGKQTRELYAAHTTDDKCRVCHALIDPLGFAFEIYDGVGRFRTTEEGRPVDASGKVTLSSGETLSFTSALELLPALATKDAVGRCLARQWFRFAVGRMETGDEEPSIEAAHREFARAERKVPELLVRLASSRAFMHRTPLAGEGI